jgi:exodeoxyribonuclease VII small subunit
MGKKKGWHLTPNEKNERNGQGSRLQRRPATELSYEEATAELNAIVTKLEDGFVDIDKLVDYLERATEIIKELEDRLKRTKAKVNELVPRLESVGKEPLSSHEAVEQGSGYESEPAYEYLEPPHNGFDNDYPPEDELIDWDGEPF